MAEQGGRSCLRIGCLGCLVVVGLTVIALAVLALLVAFSDAPAPRVEQESFSQKPPGSALEWGQRVESGEEPGALSLVPAVDEPGRIIVDLSMGHFEIVPGPAGEPVRVEAEYDRAAFELVQEYETYGDRGWVFRVEFANKLSWFRRINAQDPDNRIRIILPRGVPVTLEGKLGVGESTIELGGLWITEVDLEAGVGEHRINFGEPLLQPMDRFSLESNVGEMSVTGLGHASPGHTRISQNIGELRVDLGGAWLRDGDVAVSINIGECEVRVPFEVAVDVRSASVNMGDSNLRALRNRKPVPEGSPTLRLSLEQNIGELRVVDP